MRWTKLLIDKANVHYKWLSFVQWLFSEPHKILWQGRGISLFQTWMTSCKAPITANSVMCQFSEKKQLVKPSMGHEIKFTVVVHVTDCINYPQTYKVCKLNTIYHGGRKNWYYSRIRQFNLSTMATLGTEGRGHCREVKTRVNVRTVSQKNGCWRQVAVSGGSTVNAVQWKNKLIHFN